MAALELPLVVRSIEVRESGAHVPKSMIFTLPVAISMRLLTELTRFPFALTVSCVRSAYRGPRKINGTGKRNESLTVKLKLQH